MRFVERAEQRPPSRILYRTADIPIVPGHTIQPHSKPHTLSLSSACYPARINITGSPFTVYNIYNKPILCPPGPNYHPKLATKVVKTRSTKPKMENTKGADLFARLDYARYNGAPDVFFAGFEGACRTGYHVGRMERDVTIPTAGCPEKQEFLEKMGVDPAAPGTVAMYIKPKHSVMDSGFPAFGGYFNITQGWAVIEHVYYDGEMVYGTNHPRTERVFASEWFYHFWRSLAEQDPTYIMGGRGELPPLRTVVLSQITHEATHRLLHGLSARSLYQKQGWLTADGTESWNPAGEAGRVSALQTFRHLFGLGMGSFLTRSLTDHHIAFRNIRPVEISWRYSVETRLMEDPFVAGRAAYCHDAYMAIKLA
ncbi:hypothetical protein GGTG_04872 [Gaeumannomyces tritici R3-111a-1]|uniref:Uncharacterized protein n=1 Tax=Gaeumannomyces tritici (strain R3-111a-1) TaxID=644352 RepID=J3NUB8_GAET3|nr:hypothetical protein GGTG_04872 [Gaeumannomyces tritici R3-111a-1]EJT79789.1 hypothetical protein GGTG_04872 [Gaeumannomyces tritici R3-111a-1]